MKRLRLKLGLGIAALGLFGVLSPPSHAADKDLKIGVVAAESGSFVSAGNTIVAAAKLAATKINDAGGIKVGNDTYKIKLYIRDNRTDVNVTVAAALAAPATSLNASTRSTVRPNRSCGC